MLSIRTNSNYLYEIKKSKFYVFLYKLNNIEEIDNYLKDIKNTYKDATHYCYGYKINNLKKCSDDGEPTGTAGLPILEVLDKKNLDNILVIVVRYFGGIKLGAGGLIRAYANSVKEALEENEIINLEEGLEIKLETNYENKKDIEYLYKDNIINATYEDKITYILHIKKDNLDNLNKYNYEIIKETWL